MPLIEFKSILLKEQAISFANLVAITFILAKFSGIMALMKAKKDGNKTLQGER